jgi:bla regulator protein BlaR1
MTRHTALKLLLSAASIATVAFAQSPSIPQWQRAAGGTMSFEVASIRQSKLGAEVSNNGELDFSAAYPPTGGLLTTTSDLLGYIIFAYKIVDTSQIPSLTNQLPQWAKTEEFDIQARAENHNPTKDQMRLMMQSLLADRFKLAIHTETRQLPIYALVLDKPGMPGPQLQPHPDDVPCAGANKPAPAGIVSEPPSFCGAVQAWAVNNQRHVRMVDATMGQIAAFFAAMGGGQGGMDQRPVLDQTGLPGRFDFNIEFLPESKGPRSPNTDDIPEAPGPTFTEALKNQLGLKLVKQTAPVDTFVIEHVERPSEN